MDNVIHFKDWGNSYVSNILKEIWLDKVYLPYEGNIKNNVVLDLGMNIGLWSMYASRLAGQVYAFEPAKETYQIALKNIATNGLKNIQPYQRAIAEQDGKMTLFHSSNTTMNSLNNKVADRPDTEEVETMRIDTLVNKEEIEHIGFAKIDIEGTEDVFFMSEAFQNVVPILDSFVYEYHNWCNSTPQNINAALSDYGYKVKQIPAEALIFGATKA